MKKWTCIYRGRFPGASCTLENGISVIFDCVQVILLLPTVRTVLVIVICKKVIKRFGLGLAVAFNTLALLGSVRSRQICKPYRGFTCSMKSYKCTK